MKLVYGVGINDCRGWANHKNRDQSDIEFRIYSLWHHMMMRAYSPKFQEQCPTYIGVTVCERWHRLSNFAEDISKIPNYELWRDNPRKCICLDKDTLVPGNKEYALEKCTFLSKAESSRDVFTRCQAATKTPEAKRKNVLSRLKPILCTFPDGTQKVFESAMELERQYGFYHSFVAAICRGKKKSGYGCKFEYAQ